MNIKKVGLSLALFLISSSIFAAHNLKTSVITIPGGTIKPLGTFTIDRDKLLENVNYDIVCKVTDANNKKNNVYLRVDGYNITYLNGSFVSSQFKLNQVDNTLQFNNVYNFSPITITNLDQDDSVTVVNCTATPTVAW